MEITILHRPKSGTKTTPDLHCLGPLVFETCLRHIIFSNSDSTLKDSNYLKMSTDSSTRFEVFQSQQGYQFVLEVICGLHSLIKGETEIFGQFKDFYSAHKEIIETMGMTDFFKQLLTDCKNIRSSHIQNWSQNTYGSVTRKLLTSSDNIALIGSGHLAEEIAPWLKQVSNKALILRQPKELATPFAGFRIQMSNSLTSNPGLTVLIIAATITNEVLQEYLNYFPNLRLVIDWRGDESVRPTSSYTVFRLHDLKQDDQRTQSEAHERRQLALTEVQNKTLIFAKKTKHNPWGWEDFCA